MSQIRILIADDHLVVRQGIKMLLDTESDVEVVGEAEDGQRAIQQAERLQPDVVLMDLVMPQKDGIQATAEIKRSNHRIKVLALTTFGDEEKVRAAMEAGADGYLLKEADANALVQAIQTVNSGGTPIDPQVTRHLVRHAMEERRKSEIRPLTRREKEVLQLVARGLSNKEVALALNITEGTVKAHVGNILGKLGVSSRTEAAIYAVTTGLISAGDAA